MSASTPQNDTRTLTERRIALQWSQAKLARLVGIRSRSVSLAERGRGSATTVERIELVLALEELRLREVAEETAKRNKIARLAAAIPNGPEWQALLAALEDRALDYLEKAEPSGCDALLEIFSEAEAKRILDTYFEDDPAISSRDTHPKSQNIDAPSGADITVDHQAQEPSSCPPNSPIASTPI